VLFPHSPRVARFESRSISQESLHFLAGPYFQAFLAENNGLIKSLLLQIEFYKIFIWANSNSILPSQLQGFLVSRYCLLNLTQLAIDIARLPERRLNDFSINGSIDGPVRLCLELLESFAQQTSRTEPNTMSQTGGHQGLKIVLYALWCVGILYDPSLKESIKRILLFLEIIIRRHDFHLIAKIQSLIGVGIGGNRSGDSQGGRVAG
jgi:hypothetical protein